MANLNGSRLRHGHARKGKKSTEYVIWCLMRTRCNNANCVAFPQYGGRGIKIDPAWDDFETFLEDMGPRPSKLHSLDRIDVNGGYSKQNCRWATWKEQQRNRSNNAVYTHNGKTAPLVVLCEAFGINYGTARNRLTLGATIEQALSTERLPNGSVRRTHAQPSMPPCGS